MKNLKIILLLPFMLFFATCWLAQPQSVESEDTTSPLDGSSCETNGVTWTKANENRWLSSTNISLTLYQKENSDAVASVFFWNSKNSQEAYSILEKADPGEEIDVIQFFLRQAQSWRWRISDNWPECSAHKLVCEPSPYQIHYLHRPANDWVIDHLMTRAQGALTSKRDPEDPFDIYFVKEGPYLPVFEGRFIKDGAPLWFSTLEADHEVPYSFLAEADRHLSTMNRCVLPRYSRSTILLNYVWEQTIG